MDKLIYYSENPNLGKRVITLSSGETEYRENCKRIKGDWYVMNKTCFYINGVWYRVSSGLIDIDHETKQWFIKKEMPKNIITGVVDIKDYKPVLGFFSVNCFNNTKVHIEGLGEYVALNKDILERNGYAEDLSTGVYFSTKHVAPNKLKQIKNVVDHTAKGYNIEDNKHEYITKKTLYETFPTEISKEARVYGKMLGDLTFGIELEAAKGYLPEHLQNQLGVVICRDGSLKDENGKPGPEFVSIPLTGAKGLQTVVNIGRELSKRTVLDIKCSYHVHLGNLNINRLFLVSLFRLSYKIQNELFLMFPYYKANPEGIKEKNYNQKLPSLGIYWADPAMSKSAFENYINESYKKIFVWLSGGHVPDNIFNAKVHKHPQPHKWDRKARYYWMNAMNTIFSERGTVEFRPHTPTTNPQKIINWLFICNAIVRYASLNSKDILTNRKNKVTLNKILDYYADNFSSKGKFLSEYLKAYVNERKERFIRDYEAGDRISSWEIEEDKNYLFSYQGIGELI